MSASVGPLAGTAGVTDLELSDLAGLLLGDASLDGREWLPREGTE